MINSNLPLHQRAQLTEKLLARSTASGSPKEAAEAYSAALDELVPRHGTSPERALINGVKQSVAFTEGNWRCASPQISNPGIRAAAFRQTLQRLAEGPVQSLPGALAAVLMGTVDQLPGVVGKEAPYIQGHLLDDGARALKNTGDENARFLMEMADTTAASGRFSGSDEQARKNQLRMDALGVIASFEEPPQV